MTCYTAFEKGLDAGIAIGRKGDTILVERTASDSTIEVVSYNPETGDLRAGVFATAESAPTVYSLKKTGGRSGVSILMAVLANELWIKPDEERNSELAMQMQTLRTDLEDVPPDETAYSVRGVKICENIYRRIAMDPVAEHSILVVIPNSHNVPPMAPLSLRQGVYKPDTVLVGEFRVLKNNAVKKSNITNEDLPGMFAFSEREFSPSEQTLIPSIAPWYVVPEEVISVCQHAKATTKSSIPMRNFMMRGSAGVGKTEGARAMAAAFNLPYLSLTCSANTEIFDLLGQHLPDDGKEGSNEGEGISVHKPELPTLQDIQMNPASAYNKLTGIYDEDVSEADVYDKLLVVLAATARKEAQESGTQGQRFKYVETPLVRAMKYGYLIEVQERATRL